MDHGLSYGFFVIMGGFITRDIKHISDGFEYATITSKGVLELAREGKFLDVSPEVIQDRSKANVIGKGLVCVQVIWFTVQCIARAAARYPLVLLEVHTMVHVFCALLMYILWWKVSSLIDSSLSCLLMRFAQKPQDISEPDIIDASDCLDDIALMLLTSPITDFESKNLLYRTKPYGYTPSAQSITEPHDKLASSPRVAASFHGLPVTNGISISEFDSNEKPKVHAQQALGYMIGPKDGKVLCASKTDIDRWNLAAKAIHKAPIQARGQAATMNPDGSQVWDLALLWKEQSWSHTTVSLVPYSSDFPNRNHEETRVVSLLVETFDPFGVGIWCTLPMAYGAIHLAAWKFDFPTEVEHWLWKAAAIFIMGAFPVSTLVVFGMAPVVDRLENERERRLKKKRGSTGHFYLLYGVSNILPKIYSASIALIYLLSRIYLVVESLISLRHVPIGAYAAIPWVQDIPHL